MNDIRMKLTWHTAFNTEEELQDFLKAIADVHAQRYGTYAARDSLLTRGHYDGRLNFIRTNITRKETK